MSEIYPILWEEWVVFKRKYWKITSSALISPLLYMIAFGWGLGRGMVINGQPYINFVIPGIIALTTMNTSYSAIAVLLNIHRLYDKTFEQYIISPLPMYKFAVGKVIAGALRGMYAGFIIIGVSYLFGVKLNITFGFILIMFINGITFASLGLFGALVVNSHADMNRFGTYILLPMTFLCGTFFSPDQMPAVIKKIINFLPLTHASQGLRNIAGGGSLNYINVCVILVYFIIIFSLGIWQCYRVSA